MDRYLMDSSQIRAIRSVLVRSNTFFIVGQNSVYIPSRKEKYIDKKVVKEWADLDGVTDQYAPGEIARIELKREFPNLKKVGWQRPQFGLLNWRWPMVFSGEYKGDLVYTDLRAAYWQIYRRLWLNTQMPRGFGSLDLAPVAERLKHHKKARNAVIGIVRATQVGGVKAGKRITMRSTNPFLSPPLWAMVQAILNEIANLALLTGAIYVATDGYIHPMKSEHKIFHQGLESRLIDFRTHSGVGEILGWGNYKTPERETILHKRGESLTQRSFNSIQLANKADYTMMLDWWTFAVPNYRGRYDRLRPKY